MRLLLISLFFTFSALATDWSNLEKNNSYKLLQSFELAQSNNKGIVLSFIKGEKLKLNEVLDLAMPGLFLTLFKFEYQNCTSMNLTTDMFIIKINDSSPVVEVGAEVVNCELVIYLETKDYYTKSFFE